MVFQAWIAEFQAERQQFFQEQDNMIKVIHYENVGLQGEIQSKDQESAA